MYDFGREGFADGTHDWDTNTYKALLRDEDTDAPNLATDDNLDDILAGARVAISGAMASKTKTAGVLDCADFSFATVTGASCESIDWYKDSGVESTSALMCNIDTATGLPVTPNGANIDIIIDSGANRLLKL